MALILQRSVGVSATWTQTVSNEKKKGNAVN